MSQQLSSNLENILDMYLNYYNQNNIQIDRLRNMNNDIRNNILNIIPRDTRRNNYNYNNYNSYNYNNRNNINRNNINRNNINRNNINRNNINRNNINRNNINRPRDFTNQFVSYDYTRPINPLEYIFRENEPRNSRNNANLTNLLHSVFSDISIRPTQTQISNASRIINYGLIISPMSDSCPISLERFRENDSVVQLLHCSHIFCQESFNQWFNSNVRCPVCRHDIRDYMPINTSSSPSNSSSPPNSSPPISSNSLHFDDSNPNELTNTLIHNLTSLLYNRNSSQDTLSFDSSNNLLLFETIIRPLTE